MVIFGAIDMKRTIILSIVLLLSSVATQAQTNKEKAQRLAQTAIKYIDNKAYNEAISLLEQAHQLDSSVYRYKYEMAYAYYLKQDFAKSLQIMERLAGKEDVNDKVYQLLGNLYDMNGDTAMALRSYKVGLRKFPKSGLLYAEYGNFYYDHKNYNRALAYYERGIEVAPNYPTNYFRAAILFLSSQEEVWGMIYGEIFINLEPSTDRTKQISAMMYETYLNEISITSDSTMAVSFSKNATMINGRLPFPHRVYEPLLLLSVVQEKKLNMEAICRIRKRFIQTYYEKGYDKDYDNVLFAYQKKVLDAGHFDAYSHWVLISGDKQEFNVWYDQHKVELNAYAKWLGDNRLEVNNKNAFIRQRFEKP